MKIDTNALENIVLSLNEGGTVEVDAEVMRQLVREVLAGRAYRDAPAIFKNDQAEYFDLIREGA